MGTRRGRQAARRGAGQHRRVRAARRDRRLPRRRPADQRRSADRDRGPGDRLAGGPPAATPTPRRGGAMTAARDRTRYCAAPACDLNLAGWPHVPWDCDAPLPAPTLSAETIAALPVERRPWVQGSARAFARLNPGLVPPREPGEELPGELATDPQRRERLREQEATAVLGERAEAGLRAERLPPNPERRRVAIADRAVFARLHALDR